MALPQSGTALESFAHALRTTYREVDLVCVAAQRLVTGNTEVEPGVMLVTSGVSGVQLL